jgi:hypothetical protein
MAEDYKGKKYTPEDYLSKDRLFRGFKKADLNEGSDRIELNAISFPDFSCNWSRFSEPKDIRIRENGRPTDGCFSFSVETSRFNDMATPCHDPLPENYSHTEIRQLKQDEPITFEPPKKRKLESNNWGKTKRQLYRQNIINHLKIELEATA